MNGMISRALCEAKASPTLTTLNSEKGGGL
jgi:hypothetical protein